MKKITFRRCTVMAAVFAACLFAAGCKPNQPNPAPNPEPAPNPAPSPAPNPAPAPSIEVPMPEKQSVTPGASVQEETLVGGPVQEPTVNVKIKVQSVQLPDPANPVVYGVVHAYRGEKIYSIAVPKSIVDDDLKRAKKMRELLDIKFKSEGIGAYKLYTNADHIANPNAIASDYNFLKNNNGVPTTDVANLYIAEAKKRIVLPGLHYDAATHQYKEQIMLKPITQIGTVAGSTGAEPSKTLSVREIAALTTYPVPIEVWNTDDQAARRAAVKDSLELFLDTKLGLSKYYLFFDHTAAAVLTYAASAGATPTTPGLFPSAATHLDTYTAWFGMREADMTVRITVKSITNTVVGDKDTTDGDKKFMPMGDIGTITATVKNTTKNESGTNYLVSKALIEAIKAKFPATTAWDSEFMLFSVSAPTDDTNATGDAYAGVERLDIKTNPITDATVGAAIDNGKIIYIGRRK